MNPPKPEHSEGTPKDTPHNKRGGEKDSKLSACGGQSPMTAHDIANEFVSEYVRYETREIGAVIVERLFKIIKAAEDAARTEGFEAGQESGCPMDRATSFHRTLLLTGIEEGFADAVEKATGIAKDLDLNVHPDCGRSIARRISLLRPTGSEAAQPICTAVECYCGKHFKPEEKLK